MENFEMNSSQMYYTAGLVDYVAHSIANTILIRKITGSIRIYAIDSGEELIFNISPFDNFIQMIDGNAEILINGKSTLIDSGYAFIIPAHSRNSMKANHRFKILSTIIKSGYEDI